MKGRRALLTLALVATGLAAYWAPDPEGNVVAPSAVSRTPVAPPVVQSSAPEKAGSPTHSVLRIRSRDAEDGEIDSPFPVVAWVERAPVVAPRAEAIAAPSPPLPPSAPPLPFRVLGRYAGEGTMAVFLQLNDQNLIARVGETIGTDYRVESLDDVNLTLLHVPTSQRQTLSVEMVR